MLSGKLLSAELLPSWVLLATSVGRAPLIKLLKSIVAEPVDTRDDDDDGGLD